VDGLGRTLTIGASGSGTTQSHTTEYTCGGQVASVSADGVTTSYTYDGYGRVETETTTLSLGASGVPSEKEYTYDFSGRMLSVAVTIDSVTNTTSYEYDRLGRVVTVKDNGDTEATYTYDANGNRATMTLGNGEVTTYTYNLANLVKTLVNKDESNNTLSSCSYLYRLDGNQVGKQEGTKTTLYAYDDLGRLTAESVTENQTTVTTGYTFDAYNNRATKTIGGVTVTTYTYDANNRLTSETGVAGNTTYTYDDNGSQLTATIGSSTTTNTYDLFGQLKSYTCVDSVVTSYTYGPDGLRTSKTSGNTSTAYVWDGGNITNEFVSVKVGQNTTTTENRYVYGINRVKAFLNTVETYYLYNAHGDVTGLINTACDVIKNYVYDAFGIETNPDLADANPFRYCSQYFDKESKNYYISARYYNPNTGRFYVEDVIALMLNNMINGKEKVDPLSLNLYTYCCNNPVLFIDHSGNGPTWSQIGIAVGIIAITAVFVVAVVASAGAVGIVAGAVAASVGASSAVVGAATTVGVVGTYVVAGGIAATGANRTVEALTGRNYGVELFGEKVYTAIETSLAVLGLCSIQIGALYNASTDSNKVKDVQFSDKQSQAQWNKQMAERGWTKSSILDLINTTKTTGTSINRYTGNSCTVYFNKMGGYVVIDDVTKKIVQISQYDMKNFITDSAIKK